MRSAGSAAVPLAVPRPADDLADNRARSLRRLRGRARRYAVANHLARLCVVTNREVITDRGVMLRRVSGFIRRLRAAHGPLPYMVTLEWHPGGHGLHANVLLDRWIAKDELAALWGHGFVDVRLMRSRRRRGVSPARVASSYAVKYATKAAEEWPRQHAYEVGQGFQPEVVRLSGTDLVRRVIGVMGGEVPSYVWDSASVTDWRGPPVLFVAWG
jgi:hypothetical protein